METSGLPALVTSARIRPSPGVSISSARHETGSSPSASGSPRTRLCQRPVLKPLPVPGSPEVLRAPAAALVNIAPPSRSRLPVSAFTTSTSQLASAAELLGAGADPAVDGRRRRRPPARAPSGGSPPASIPHAPATSSGGEVARQLLDLVQAVEVLAEPARVGQALVEERVHDAHQQVGVAAGADEVVLVGGLGGARAARIDHHDLAAALADRPQPAAHVGRGEQAAVRTRAGWRPGSAGGRCGPRRAPGSTAARRTSARSTRAWASGRRCSP